MTTTSDSNVDSLPTISDQAGPCPRCNRVSNYTITQAELSLSKRGNERAAALTCLGCQDSTLVVERYTSGQGWKALMWWPTPHTLVESVAGLPSEISESYEEGVRCVSVQAPHAAVAMFRTSLAHIVEDKGSAAAKGKSNLYDRVKQMVAEKTLWESFGDWADHIRSTGNAGAHPEKFEAVSQEQAEDLRAFVRQTIEFLYVQPARIAAAMPVKKKSAVNPASPPTP